MARGVALPGENVPSIRTPRFYTCLCRSHLFRIKHANRQAALSLSCVLRVYWLELAQPFSNPLVSSRDVSQHVLHH